MMHGHEKSDSVIVAVKPANKAVHPAAEQSAAEAFAAEPGEPRAETKGNADQQTMPWAQSQTSMPTVLDRIREGARERKQEKFISLFHHISIDLLAEAFYQLEVDAAPGVDRLLWKDYEGGLQGNLEDLHARVQRGAYRARPSRRVYIPKPDGRQRPLAVAALEDKIRPTGDGCGAERDLRGGLPRVLVWVPARTRGARRSGCARGRDRPHKGELDTG